jgi:hypothetical protein
MRCLWFGVKRWTSDSTVSLLKVTSSMAASHVIPETGTPERGECVLKGNSVDQVANGFASPARKHFSC